MKIVTRNSTYEIKGNTLLRNGEVYTEQITYQGNMAKDFTTIYSGKPEVGAMLYIECVKPDGNKGYIRTSTIQEVIGE